MMNSPIYWKLWGQSSGCQWEAESHCRGSERPGLQRGPLQMAGLGERMKELIAQWNKKSSKQEYLASKIYFFFLTFRIKVSLSTGQKRPTTHQAGRGQEGNDHKQKSASGFQGRCFALSVYQPFWGWIWTSCIHKIPLLHPLANELVFSCPTILSVSSTPNFQVTKSGGLGAGSAFAQYLLSMVVTGLQHLNNLPFFTVNVSSVN